MKQQRIEIKDYEDLLCIMEEMIDEFMESLYDKGGFTREVEEDDSVDEGVQWMWTYKAQKLYDRYYKRLGDIFTKYFPENDFELTTSWYREY